MANTTDTPKELQKILVQYTDAFRLSATYCQPEWENFMRYYKFWRGIKPVELDSTVSGIWVNIFHQIVQNRFPLIFENVFSSPEYLTLKADSPEYELSVGPAQTWLRDLLDEKIKIQESAIPTVQSALIGGTAFRMPYVRYANKGGKQVPIITSKALNFFNCLPSPNGNIINPDDYNGDDALDWMFVIDWWSEDKLERMATRKGFIKGQIGKLLKNEPAGTEFIEDDYKNQFKTVNGLDYDGPASQYRQVPGLSKKTKKRRIVHWFLRDKHIIVAEDLYVIYEGKPPLGEGIIPITKYAVTPDLNGFWGISQLELTEDVVMAMIMNLNYRMDHLLGVMFPITWIRDDVRRGKTEDDFISRPYATNFFPTSVSDITKAIHYDRRPEVGQQTFLEEDRLKAMLQGVSGELETTGSYGDVVGNKTATGVTTIAAQLKSRPNMEAAILERTGFRPEAEMLLKLGAMHINTPQSINTPATSTATAWTEINPHDIEDAYTVQMHGARYMVDKNQQFQKIMGLYPLWNNNPNVDQYQLNTQVAKAADIFPEPDKIFVPPAPVQEEVPSARPSALPERPGGAASALDPMQAAQSVQNRNTVEPRTGSAVRAF